MYLAGIEPALRNWNGILSPTCLPISPQVQKQGLIGSAIRRRAPALLPCLVAGGRIELPFIRLMRPISSPEL